MSRSSPALTHEWIWRAIDTLASRRQLSPSALARLAGLDPTAFNRSKRYTPEGRPRWPSTESIAKVLDATGTSLDEFAEIELSMATSAAEAPETPALASVPLVGEVRDAAIPRLESLPGAQSTRRNSAAAGTRPMFAIAVADRSLEPVYSQGNTLIVCPAETARPGDRVVVKPAGLIAQPLLLVKSSVSGIELAHFRPEMQRMRLQRDAVEWIARIVWVRQ